LNVQTSNRFADTSDAQAVCLDVSKTIVQKRGPITTDKRILHRPVRARGPVLNSWRWNPYRIKRPVTFKTMISYVAIPTGTTYSLERLSLHWWSQGADECDGRWPSNLPSPTSATAPLTRPSIFLFRREPARVSAAHPVSSGTQGFVPAAGHRHGVFNVDRTGGNGFVIDIVQLRALGKSRGRVRHSTPVGRRPRPGQFV